MGKHVELLAPAGSYEAFLGALNAGADAVYLGGEKFGARAYADNFNAEQIIRALHVAHFYGKKIYLTVNTLLKERELAMLYEYLAPFYDTGLDGVIVQDFGVLRFLKEHFPGLLLHASTQMTVTGVRGAALLKEFGVNRIVPARELALNEVRKIKAVGVEVECFIHGAMCYSYSGQCLFSSILGGRSGNRGRCAQPCRLPYEIYDGKNQLLTNAYPLSLKDMCTLEYLPALLEAGIDSFKIEGRMKRPEYAAGVTAIYRKYMDLYYEKGTSGFRIDPADMKRLHSLYIRSEIQTGYYERHNGKEMISLKNPGYSGSDEHILSQIREKYIKEPDKMSVRMQAEIKTEKPLLLRIMPGSAEAPGPVIEMTGEEVQHARKAPLTKADVKKQLCKTGDSLLSVTDCDICIEGAGFVPVRSLNDLRRQAVEAYETAVIESRLRHFEKNLKKGHNVKNRPSRSANCGSQTQDKSHAKDSNTAFDWKKPDRPAVDCLVSTREQLQALLGWGGCRRIYIESDLFLRESGEIRRILEETATTEAQQWYLALPYVLRERDDAYLKRLEQTLTKTEIPIGGFLVRNLEGLAFIHSAKQKKTSFSECDLVPDAGLYCFNAEAVRFLSAFAGEITIPYELNAGEAAHLARTAGCCGMQVNLIAYSRIPMMITANCLQKTADLCGAGEKKKRQLFLKDRKTTAFPVVINCEHCYNVIYNSVPYSLHGAQKELNRIAADALRYDFVTENGQQCRDILEGNFPFTEYTTGHCKRGVE